MMLWRPQTNPSLLPELVKRADMPRVDYDTFVQRHGPGWPLCEAREAAQAAAISHYDALVTQAEYDARRAVGFLDSARRWA